MVIMRHTSPETNDTRGEQVSIVNGQNRREQFIYPTDQQRAFFLNINYYGNAIWGPGVCITRRNSRILALELVTAGSIEFVQDKKRYLVGPGEIFILRPGGEHLYRTGPEGRAHKRVISLGGDLLQQLLVWSGLLQADVVRLRDARAFAGLIKQAMRVYQARAPHFMRRLSALACSMLLMLADELRGPNHPPPVQRAIDHMYQSLGRPLTLPELSRAAAASVPHLCWLFRRHLGTTPLAFFRRLKVQEAKTLLQLTGLRIEEMATRMGYEDIAHFSHMFKKETGVSPREFRKAGKQTTKYTNDTK